ncbi:hypothetical protein ACFWE5_03900 [Cellulosimicrobium funkei]|uniref:hypothetical protein n=1 Tax=Cellulosimicrobium funkei TaxID=264251 RepID=UPI003655CDCC
MSETAKPRSELRDAATSLLPDGPRRCIFCGERPLTREHVWPTWLAADLKQRGFRVEPAPEDAQQNEWFGVSMDRREVMQEIERRGKTPPLTALISRTVCATCNNGWMHRLEDAVRTPLLALSREEDASFIASDLRTIGAWAVKTAIMWNAQEPASLGWTSREIAEFGATQVPPVGTSVAVARWPHKDAQGPSSVGGQYTLPEGSGRIGIAVLLVGHAALLVRSTSTPSIAKYLPTIDKRWTTIWNPLPRVLSWRRHRVPTTLDFVRGVTEPVALPDSRKLRPAQRLR